MKRESKIYGAERLDWVKNDCCVRALACAAGVEYKTASAVFSTAGRPLKKGTPWDVVRQVHESWLKLERLPLDNIPLAVFTVMFPQGSFVVFKHAHAFAVVDGVVHDWEGTSKATTQLSHAYEMNGEGKRRLAKIAELVG